MADPDQNPRPSPSDMSPTHQSGFATDRLMMPTPMGWMSSDQLSKLWAVFMAHDSRYPRVDAATLLGTPMDVFALGFHKLGVPIPGGNVPADQVTQWITGDPEMWRPAASVPLSSQHIRGLLDDSPSFDSLLDAVRRRSGLL